MWFDKTSKSEYIIKSIKIIYFLSILKQSPAVFTTGDCFCFIRNINNKKAELFYYWRSYLFQPGIRTFSNSFLIVF